MIAEESLKPMGLNKSEAKVYLRLLETGAASPPQIAKATGIARTNCYHLLFSLKEKGLISEQQKGERMQYIARDPQALLASIERKKEAVEAMLPDLRTLYGSRANKPKIHFYQGFDEVKEIYLQSLNSEYIKGFGSTKQLSELDPDFFTHYIKEIKKRKIILRDILTSESGEKGLPEGREILGGLYEAILLPPKYKGLLTDMLLWDDNVALITLAEPIFGTVLTSSVLSKTFHAIHDALWEQLYT